MKIRNRHRPAETADPSLRKKSFVRRYLPDEKPIAALVILVALCAGALLALNYRPKPKTEVKSIQLAGVSIVNKDKAAAAKELTAAVAAQKINIVINGKTYTYSDSDLGVKRDTSSLLDVAYAPRDSIINDRLANKKQSATLNTYVQKKKLLAAIDSNIASYKTTQNASVSVSGGNLTVNPGRAGISIDYDGLIRQLKQSDLKSSVTITANFSEQQPQILTAAAEDAKAQAEGLIKPDYGVSAANSGTKYASLAQKASWLVFTPDESTHKIGAAINIITARNTMAKIAQSFAQPAKNRITFTATDGTEVDLDDGQPEVDVDQPAIDDGLNKLADALTAQQSYTFPITLSTKAQGARNLGTSTGGKFVLVDVADYRAYAINDTSVDRTMVVSTGRPGLETPKGHFHILSKTPLVTMRGCNKLVGCWVVPNVPNAEFFTNDGDALHGTYWYVNWGHQNASHGCVNLQLADASWLYGWTQVGTDVIVA